VAPSWLDPNGVFKATTITADSFGRPGTTGWQLYSAVWEVPTGISAAQLAIAIGFIAPGVNQDLYVDNVVLKRASVIEGGVWVSETEPASGITNRMVVRLSPGDGVSEYPSAYFDGQVLFRPLFGRLVRASGTQTITSGTWQKVLLNQTMEAIGVAFEYDVGIGTWFIRVPRNAIYNFGGQVNWDAFFSATTGGIQACAVERWSEDGLTLLERYVAQSNYQGNTFGICATSCLLPGRANKNERIYLTAYQDHTSSLTASAGAGAVGGVHILTLDYRGEAV
jgi:hypothetical protein